MPHKARLVRRKEAQCRVVGGRGVTSKAQTALSEHGDKGEKLTGGSVRLQPRCCGKQKVRGDKLPEMK